MANGKIEVASGAYYFPALKSLWKPLGPFLRIHRRNTVQGKAKLHSCTKSTSIALFVFLQLAICQTTIEVRVAQPKTEHLSPLDRTCGLSFLICREWASCAHYRWRLRCSHTERGFGSEQVSSFTSVKLHFESRGPGIVRSWLFLWFYVSLCLFVEQGSKQLWRSSDHV